jgi:chromosome segregation ATPase
MKGEKEYDSKEMEIQKLKQQIEKDTDKLKKISIIDILLREKREQIHKMQKDLLQLKAERRAMEEELAIPINIHRWTLLESSDPERFEKLKTYQQLQAELVQKTNEVVKIQGSITQQMAIYNDLQAQVPKATKGLKGSHADLASNVKKQRGELEFITAQLDMYRDMVKEYRKELSEVQTELNHERSNRMAS